MASKNTIQAAITTASGAIVEASLAPVGERMPADGWRVSIIQDGVCVGRGRWVGEQIVDIDARIGAADGSETAAAYEALDEALRDAIADDEAA